MATLVGAIMGATSPFTSVTVPNRGPLTASFTQPSTCTATTTTIAGSRFLPEFFLGIYGTVGDTACLPPATTTVPTLAWQGGTDSAGQPTSYEIYIPVYYSPGICPSGYYYASKDYTSPITSKSAVHVTRAACCPDGYTMFGLTAVACATFITSRPYLTNILVISGPASSTSFASDTYMGRGGWYATVLAPAFTVGWQATDTDAAASWSAAVRLNPALNATSSYGSASTGRSGSGGGGGGDGAVARSVLASAAIRGGIGAGISVFVLLVVGAVLFCLRKRKRNQQAAAAAASQGTQRVPPVAGVS